MTIKYARSGLPALFMSLTVLSVLSVALFAGNTAFAQAGSKEAQKFQSLVETTRTDLGKASAQFETTMAVYNALVNGEAENPEKAYKGLTKEIGKSEKAWTAAAKSYKNMGKAGEKLFKGWQKEVDAYANEQIKQLSMERLEDVRAKNQKMVERMTAVQEAYEPFIGALNDQAQFMGRDMSPATMEALAPMAEELNVNAATLQANIDSLLNGDAATIIIEEPAEMDDGVEVEEVIVPAAGG
jgi:hypothetical protein